MSATDSGSAAHARSGSSGHGRLELPGAMIGRVLAERAPSRRGSDRVDLRVGPSERLHHVLRTARDQNLASRLEEIVEPLPLVADDRAAARGGLEQAPR